MVILWKYQSINLLSRKQIYWHCKDFVSIGIIQENQDFNQSNNDELIKFHFIDNSESKIAEEINFDIEKGIQIDTNFVICKAKCYCWSSYDE